MRSLIVRPDLGATLAANTCFFSWRETLTLLRDEEDRECSVAYQHGRKSIREAYEEQFAPQDAREVTVHRVVNIVEKRNPMTRPGAEFDRGYDDQRYRGPRDYNSGRGYHTKDTYRSDDSQYYDENSSYDNYRRHSPPHRDDSYPQTSYGRDDLRHQLSSRNRSRGPPHRRGQGYGPPPRLSAYYKSSASKSFTSSSSVEDSPHPASSKEKSSASAAETEAVAAANSEPKIIQEEDIKARRSEAIKAKVAEIEKQYRQDCETFRTVVKMLIDKEPSLDGMLQAPLDKNLLEIRQHCLDAIKSFVMELDEILGQPEATA
ncbi:PREDICTED: periphilin-1-like [Cyprinodon variegatus]|uniref:periphilin-1-like n=1 Tax=Cyprinodon variegatus TaxID=28743 RepID=UPI000742A843|nr:PREDICTED: periphilin-1-like [Cyprinodon variegatus]